MICKKCGRELIQGTKFCTGCGAVVEQNCPNCGCAVNDSMKFCVQCGFSFEQKDSFAEPNQGYGNNVQVATGEYDRGRKVQRLWGILNTVAGALAICCAFLTDDPDLDIVLVCCGIGILVVGILQLCNRSEKAININRIVFGALAVLSSFDFFGISIGCPLIVTGILGLLHKSLKAGAIVEIVFGGIILFMGFIAIIADVFCGFGLLVLGEVNLTIGILKLLNLKYIKS